jgi:hypothetical protein
MLFIIRGKKYDPLMFKMKIFVKKQPIPLPFCGIYHAAEDLNVY